MRKNMREKENEISYTMNVEESSLMFGPLFKFRWKYEFSRISSVHHPLRPWLTLLWYVYRWLILEKSASPLYK